MRRKPGTSGGSGGGYNNNQQRNKPRYQQGGGSGGGDHRSHNSNRPRKNYSAMREKYLNQARDALAAGDRVLAENWFQHADHCYRMMVEEGYQVRNNYTPPQPGDQGNEQGGEQTGETGNEQQSATSDESSQDHTTQLPAFITGGYDHSEQPKPVEQPQNWEE